MIEVHKIGLHLYKGIDKNSGLFEYNMIKDYVNTYFKIVQKDNYERKMLVIINGQFSSVEEEQDLLNKMNNYDIKVFIASDIVALTNNKCIIDNCDVLLHQCPKRNLPGVAIKQMYSYVPEMFYFNSNLLSTDIGNTLFFGGGVRDMEEQLNSIVDITPCHFLLKNNNNDARLPYEDYLALQSMYKYTLITCRKDYSNIGWVTARFIECICNNNYPIVLHCYDVDNYFNLPKVVDITDIPAIIRYVDSNPDFRYKVISEYKERFKNDRFKLLTILEEIYDE